MGDTTQPKTRAGFARATAGSQIGRYENFNDEPTLDLLHRNMIDALAELAASLIRNGGDPAAVQKSARLTA